MRKKIGLGLLLSLWLASSAFAVDLEKVGMFAAGFATGTVFHELGHASVVVLEGGNVDSIEFQKTTYSNLRYKEDRQWAALGGYMFQTAASEVIFENKEWRHNDFALGWMALGLYTNLSNPIKFYIFGQKDNDLGSYESEGGNPAIPAALMVAYSGWTLYRLFNETDIPLYISKNAVGIEIKF